MGIPALAAMAARTRSDVGRMVAQKTQMSRTMERPSGTCERSVVVQLPLLRWFSISARSAAVQPARSSRSACLRVLRFTEGHAAKAQPVPRP
eukprot:6190495-Pleurochrysis_carterae.AAC.6